jgi:MEMO1 family protein
MFNAQYIKAGHIKTGYIKKMTASRMCGLVVGIFTVFIFFVTAVPCLAREPAAKVRQAVWAGRFYPAEADRLEKMIEQFTRQARKTKLNLPSDKPLRALIMPHAGYVYSGPTAAYAGKVLQADQFKKVIVMGPDHRVGFRYGAISDVDAYDTPLGRINLHPDAEKLRNDSFLFRSIPACDNQEHSVEVLLPFLQYYLKRFEMVPMVLGHGNIEAMAEVVSGLLDKDTLLAVSSDLSHYLSYKKAVSTDRETIKMILNLDEKKLAACKECACGKTPIRILVNLAIRYGWKPVLLDYRNSGDTAGNRSGVVGYTTIAFYGDLNMENTGKMKSEFDEKHGRILVRLARQTIMKKLGVKVDPKERTSLEKALEDEVFQSIRGTFVTLNKNNQLRGCIGTLVARESLSESVRSNAVSAAFRDYRFPNLSAAELDDIDIEISILTKPQPLDYSDGKDLISKLRKNVDGLIIRKGMASATFLPQVWEQLPLPEDFLGHLCRKAGLPANAWEDGSLEVQTYQVQYFEESK